MANSLVSVIIPTYNTDKYITGAINSVFKQAYRPLEVIVVDDGSTDKTYEVIKRYHAQNINNVKMIELFKKTQQLKLTEITEETVMIYIYQENRGRAGARNTGIKIARGKYVAFLDSDDLWTADKLTKQVEMIRVHQDIDFLFGDKQRFSDDGKVVIASMFKKQGYDQKFFGDILYVHDAYRKLLTGNFIPTGTVIMKKECFGDVGFFDENIYAEDYEFWLRASLFCNMAYAKELWEMERDREGSGSKNLKAVYLSNIKTLEKHEMAYRERLSKLHIDLNSIIRDAYRDTGYFFLTHDRLLARECFKKSLRRGGQIKTMFYLIATFLGVSFIKAIQQSRQ